MKLFPKKMKHSDVGWYYNCVLLLPCPGGRVAEAETHTSPLFRVQALRVWTVETRATQASLGLRVTGLWFITVRTVMVVVMLMRTTKPC